MNDWAKEGSIGEWTRFGVLIIEKTVAVLFGLGWSDGCARFRCQDELAWARLICSTSTFVLFCPILASICLCMSLLREARLPCLNKHMEL